MLKTILSAILLSLIPIPTTNVVPTVPILAPRPPDPCYDEFLNDRRFVFGHLFECVETIPTPDRILCAERSLDIQPTSLSFNDIGFKQERFLDSLNGFWECLLERGALSDELMDFNLHLDDGHWRSYACVLNASSSLTSIERCYLICAGRPIKEEILDEVDCRQRRADGWRIP